MIQKIASVKELDYAYSESKNQLAVLYGSDGCQKEQYVREFLKGKEYFYYRAAALPEEEQKKRFAAQIASRYPLDEEEADYEIYFENMYSSDGSKLVFVIDEFEYLAKKNSDFLEEILNLKQRNSARNEIMILLCSSSPAFVEQKMKSVLGKSSSLIDVVYKIEPLQFLDIVRMFPENTVSECVGIFGIFGSVRNYLKHWNAKESIKENVCKMIHFETAPQECVIRGCPWGILSADNKLFFTAERYLGKYHTILTAIAAGCKKLKELRRYTGYSGVKIRRYLKKLIESDIVEKIVSFEITGRGKAQKVIYRIKNTWLHFWYRFVYPNLSDFYIYTPEEFYDRYIESELREYLESCFVKVCMEYLKLMNRAGRLPFEIRDIGTWIGKGGIIDIAAQNDEHETIVGICRWSKEQMEYTEYEKLEELMKEAKISAKYCFLFSGGTFAPALVEKAGEDKRVILVDMTEL